MPGFSEGLRPRLRCTLILGVFFSGLLWFDPVEGQIISPGKLSSVHGELEGMGNCTQCHKLRTPGADPDRCLACHQALDRRIEGGLGYHGALEDPDCGTCHKEHLGEDFDLIRMDPDTFSHGLTGHLLEGAHENLDCRSCHVPALIADEELRQELSGGNGLSRTYLGLSKACGSCHSGDGPHDGQFSPRDCSACHSQVEWEGAEAFDHDETSYPLLGRHSEVECSGCHILAQGNDRPGLIRYVGVDASDCNSCHKNPHVAPMPGTCQACHRETDWREVDRSAVESVFDHTTTAFPLLGAHEAIGCQACHTPSVAPGGTIALSFPGGSAGRAFPTPEHELCTSCHLDTHEGVFQDRQCDACHTQNSWAPPSFDRARHGVEASFELTGAHSVTPCSDCHEVGEGDDRTLRFRIEDPASCAVCHKPDDPHEGAFSEPGCDLCHTSTVFSLNEFDHLSLETAGWTGLCFACHENDDPHGGQFPDRDCGDCHGTEQYEIQEFDHGETRFPLEGAHADVPCSSCHLSEPGPGRDSMIRYRPLDLSCTACHGGAS